MVETMEVMQYKDLWNGQTEIVQLESKTKPQPIRRCNSRLGDVEKRLASLEQRVAQLDVAMTDVEEVAMVGYV